MYRVSWKEGYSADGSSKDHNALFIYIQPWPRVSVPKAELVSRYPEISRTCAAAMRSCYSSWPAHSLFTDRSVFPESEVNRMLKKAVELGHMDIFEHGFLTWIVEASQREVLSSLMEHRFLYVSEMGADRWLVTATIRSLLDTKGSSNPLLRELQKYLNELAPWISTQPEQSQIKQSPKEGYPEGTQVWLLSYTDFASLYGAVDVDPERLLWHGGFTFSLSGVSRSLTHQLVRHRLAAYSQQSQRHVAVAKGRAWYGMPPGISGAAAEEYRNFMDSAASLYAELLRRGVRKEDARFILPNATLTHITMTATAWEYRRMFSQRLDPAAQWEIRDVSWAMFSLAYIVLPSIAELEDPARSMSDVRDTLRRLLPILDESRDRFSKASPGDVLEIVLPSDLLSHPVSAYLIKHRSSRV